MEHKEAMELLTKQSQRKFFSKEIKILEEGKKVCNKSTLVKFYPFLDKRRLLRMGSRLSKANIRKYPMLMHKDAHLTRLIMEGVHQDSMHSGKTVMLSLFGGAYKCPGEAVMAKGISNKCIVCRKDRAQAAEQLMGSLPQYV